MYRQAHSENYDTVYLKWPDTISPRCDLCGNKVKFAHPGNGKLIRTLDGDIHQVVYFYTCPNEKCENSERYFNPAPRYDCSTHYYDQSVMDRVSREIFLFKQDPDQIHLRLTLDYNVEISLRTVQRRYQEILLIKSAQIDQNTYEIIQKNKGIILAMDAQNPGGGINPIWMFTDAFSSRLLYTMQSKSTPAEKLRDTIKNILETYQTNLLGVVSDKQGNNVACMEKYFKGIPHQYCTYHFASHLWKHMEIFDSQIYLPLSKMINHLYIHKNQPNKTIKFEEHGQLTINEVFRAMDEDLHKMLKYRNKKFEFLRGLALYRTLKRYIDEMKKCAIDMAGDLRIEKIFLKTLTILETILKSVETRFFQTLFMYDTFKILYRLIYHEILEKEMRINQINEVFRYVWTIARIKDPNLEFKNLRSFLPTSKASFVDTLGEWVRLWKSYKPGLFAYYDFPKDIRTNTEQERSFGKEKMTLIKRSSKKEGGNLLELQGELYLRFCYCTNDELMSSIVEEYMNNEVKNLRYNYKQKVKKMMSKWYYKGESLSGVKEVLTQYHPKWG